MCSAWRPGPTRRSIRSPLASSSCSTAGSSRARRSDWALTLRGRWSPRISSSPAPPRLRSARCRSELLSELDAGLARESEPLGDLGIDERGEGLRRHRLGLGALVGELLLG